MQSSVTTGRYLWLAPGGAPPWRAHRALYISPSSRVRRLRRAPQTPQTNAWCSRSRDSSPVRGVVSRGMTIG